MKKILFSLFVILSTTAFAQEDVKKAAPPAGNALVGDFYGAGVSTKAEKKAVTTTQLDQQLSKNKKLNNVVVKGKVTDVCPKKGCWVSIETENNETFFVKMKDYAFFVPTSLNGKNVVLEGTAELKLTSVDELKHYAKDAKKSQEEIEKITQPTEEIRFMASGIKVVN